MQNETEKSNTLVSKSLPMKPTIFISFLFSMSKAGRYVLSSEEQNVEFLHCIEYLFFKTNLKMNSCFMKKATFYNLPNL